MKEIAVSKFKARCLAILQGVRKTRRPVLVTRFGQPVAEVRPVSTPAIGKEWLGSMRGTGKILGDLVAPAADEKDWESLAP